MNKDTKPNYAGSHKSIRMKGSSRGHYRVCQEKCVFNIL